MDLLLTLGHNSSAIAVADDGRTVGYEEERFSRKKSDSSCPVRAARAALTALRHEGPVNMFVSHWFDGFDPSSWNPKYWAGPSDWLGHPVGSFVSLAPDFTHHDAHAWSAIGFHEAHYGAPPRNVVVADGFGNMGECVSVYGVSSGRPVLLRRTFGHRNSLGMAYQCATSYCGMKEHEDEWKFLGHESLVSRSADPVVLRRRASEVAAVLDLDPGRPCPVTSLPEAKESWYQLFASVDLEARRPVVGYFVQSLLEEYYDHLVDRHHLVDCAFAGGVHYNVKLNQRLAGRLDSCSFCPLAGDQGAAIGLYLAAGHRFDFSDLCWGKRDLKHIPSLPHVYRFESPSLCLDFVAGLLLRDRIVDFVRGGMEFGPRALCHTSTLARPTAANVDRINAMNARDTVMPMAPVVTQEQFNRIFGDTNVVGSFDYMVCAAECAMDTGFAHPHPTNGTYSGRPQIARDPWFVGLLDATGPLINTSFNVHGHPIVLSVDDAVNDFGFQWARGGQPVLVVGDF